MTTTSVTNRGLPQLEKSDLELIANILNAPNKTDVIKNALPIMAPLPKPIYIARRGTSETPVKNVNKNNIAKLRPDLPFDKPSPKNKTNSSAPKINHLYCNISIANGIVTYAPTAAAIILAANS
jgi:hypothetical protein